MGEVVLLEEGIVFGGGNMGGFVGVGGVFGFEDGVFWDFGGFFEGGFFLKDFFFEGMDNVRVDFGNC